MNNDRLTPSDQHCLITTAICIVGLAVGFILLGIFMAARNTSAAAQAENAALKAQIAAREPGAGYIVCMSGDAGFTCPAPGYSTPWLTRPGACK